MEDNSQSSSDEDKGDEQQKQPHHKQDAISEPVGVGSAATVSGQVNGGDNSKQKPDGTDQPPSDNKMPGERSWSLSPCWHCICRFCPSVNWPAINAFLIVLATVVIALATIFQAKYGEKQWEVMVKQNEIMQGQLGQTERALTQTRMTVEIDQRAWLSIEVPTIDALESEKPISGTFVVRNSGKTPGKILRRETGIVFPRAKEAIVSADILSVLVTFEHAPRVKRTGFTIAPNSSSTYVIAAAAPDDAILREVASGNKIAVVISLIEYHDVFGNECHSWSVFTYSITTGKWNRYPDYDHMD